MEHVYKNSYFSIAATHAADGRGGLFVERDTDFLRPYKVTATWNGEEPVELFITEDLVKWVDKFNLEPLITRAWVVQERLLAPRICHFTATEVIWECNELWACERIPGTALQPKYYLPDTNLPSHSFSSLSLDSPNWDLDARNCWVGIVHVYSKSNLTRETDRLAAISGIARKMQGFLGDDYLAGMWRQNLEYQLIWSINPIEMTRNKLPPSTRSPQYIAPTWSWASVNGTEVILSVAWTLSSIETSGGDKALLAQVIDVGVTPANNATLCEDGFLHLRCFLIPVTPRSLTDATCILQYNNGEFQQEEIPFCFTTVDTLITNLEDFSFWCAPISHHRLSSDPKSTYLQGLLLCRHKSDWLCFRRCGLFSLNSPDSDDLDRFWKQGYDYGKSALLTPSLRSELCKKILTYKLGSGGINYKRRRGIPQFKITIK
ncbi:hypothetical protein EG329_002943 [Mollisiaceae sp. DMI_Dod_QoI]|nr:hypothetical protein EG329_002943 [Helotiales sp. DMI_Dod_QoI]